MRIPISVAVLLAALLSGCGLTESADEARGFVIVGYEDDTLYLGEPTWIKIGEDLPDASKLVLFRKTLHCPIDSVRGRYIHFTAPMNAEPGEYRLYKDDSILATGAPHITILNQQFDAFYRWFVAFGDRSASDGDVISITGNFPVRERDIAVTINRKPVRLIYRDNRSVQFRVEPTTPEGKLRLRIFDGDTVLGYFSRPKRQGGFLRERLVDSVVIEGRSFIHSVPQYPNGPGDSTFDYWQNFFFNSARGASAPPESKFFPRGDTMNFVVTSLTWGDSMVFDLRLKESAASGRLSGRVTIRPSSRSGESGIRFRLEDVPWHRDTLGNYVIELQGLGVGEHFFDDSPLVPNGRWKAAPNSSLKIVLKPKR